MRTVLAALLLMTLASMQSVFALNDIPALMPMPQEVRWGGGDVQFASISIRTLLGDIDQDSRRRIDFAVDRFRAQMGEVGVTVSGAGEYPVGIRIDEVGVPRHADESYLMSVTEKGARITAPTATGVFYALQTLRQLIDNTTTGSRISTVEIRDYPSFGIRGFMHDVGRNFISLEKLKEQIDIMAFYKLNVFHWHLSDDPGWRLESKLYPELQAEHAFTRMPGMYYTQAEFIEMVEYCWLRNITVIPELDSPGHTAAFRRAFNCVMRDPIAKERMVNLIHELCSLASAEIMPYIHLGTDEVRNSDEYVGDDYLPALYRAVRENEREVISWWHGLYIPGEAGHIQQTWARHAPRSGIRHIDSRSNYVNHMCVMDAPLRMLFQQPGRVPHSDEINLGGILCYWPDTKVENEDLSFTNSPVYTSMVAYSEAVWTGIEKDQPEYWAQIPPPGTEAFERFREFEHRLLGQRRFLTHVPFQYVRQTDIPWRLIGPFRSDWLDEIETPENGIRESYRVGDREYRWWEDASIGGTVHVRHFFGFESAGSDREFGSGEDVVYALTYLHSPKEQEVDFWISFNTTSTSDPRSGAPVKGHWGANPICDIWVNDERVRPPNWYQPGRVGREVALVDEVYTSRPPTTVLLQEGWNKVLLRTAPHWKWSYTFVPVSASMVTRTFKRSMSGLPTPPIYPASRASKCSITCRVTRNGIPTSCIRTPQARAALPR